MLLIKKYNTKLKNQWDSFVKKSFNGTFFQTQKFLLYHKNKNYKDHSLIFYYNNKIAAILPDAEIQNNQFKILHSHPGASYGGIVIENNSFNVIELIIDMLEKYFLQID